MIFNKILDRLEETIICILMVLAVFIIFIAVVHRFSIGFAADLSVYARASGNETYIEYTKSFFKMMASIRLTWAQEACIYMFVWMAKFGAAYGVRIGIHVGVDVLVEKLSPKNARLMTIIAFLGGIIFTLIVSFIGADFVWHIAKGGQVSQDLEMPMWIVYLAVPLGTILMCYRFIQALHLYVTTGFIAHHNHADVDGIEIDNETIVRDRK